MRRDAPERPERDSLTALGRVAGELVHDLANEVQVLQGWAVIARGEAAAGRPPLNEIQRVVDISARLGRMLRDMLETVSGESLTPELDFAPHPLTEATLNERVREVGSREILFRSSLPEGTRLTGRASFWSRIVTNLVSNAARFAEQTVIVALSLRVESNGRKMVVLRVEDDGPGIPPDDHLDIFSPFWRGDDEGGAGLGLSSVAWAVAQLGGRVRYATDSTLEGAAFEVLVPAAGPLALKFESTARQDPPLQGLKLLLIDDDRSVRMAMSRLLERAGAAVEDIDPLGMPDTSVIERIETLAPDVILMDLDLGDRGGLSLWRLLGAIAPELATRVAFVTGLVAGDASWAEADATGQPILGKPFDLAALVRTVNQLRQHG